MRKILLSIPLAIASAVALSTSCGPDASRFEGAWLKTDSIDKVSLSERLTLQPDGKFTQDYTLSNAGRSSGSFSIEGRWHTERHGIVLEYDTLTTRWHGDSLMASAMTREVARGLSRISADTQFGLSDISLQGSDTLCAKQGGVNIKYIREKGAK